MLAIFFPKIVNAWFSALIVAGIVLFSSTSNGDTPLERIVKSEALPEESVSASNPIDASGTWETFRGLEWIHEPLEFSQIDYRKLNYLLFCVTNVLGVRPCPLTFLSC
jgi:hypothetical protein